MFKKTKLTNTFSFNETTFRFTKKFYVCILYSERRIRTTLYTENMYRYVHTDKVSIRTFVHTKFTLLQFLYKTISYKHIIEVQTRANFSY